jgi:hypothetical protein
VERPVRLAQSPALVGFFFMAEPARSFIRIRALRSRSSRMNVARLLSALRETGQKLQFLYFLLAAAAFRIKAAPLVASSSESNPDTAEYFLPNLGHNEIHVDPCIGDGLRDRMAQAGSVVALNQQSR